MQTEFLLNGNQTSTDVDPQVSLADMVRTVCGLTGTHLGCEQGACGACAVLLNGQVVRSCLMLGVQADGQEITTVEGVIAEGPAAGLPERFLRHRAFQCGFCTPGMIVTLAELLNGQDALTRDGVSARLSGNICRCTGYEPIIDAACEALADLGLLEERP